MKRFLSDKKMKLLSVLVISVLYFLYLYYICSRIEIDSDYSNLVLEANDILRGNVFLSGWNLTGISFVTTDLLAFLIGAAVFGVSVRTYHLAVTIMIFMLVAGGWLLCKNNSTGFRGILIYLLLCAVPASFAVYVLRAHTAAAAYALFGLYLADKIRRGEEKKIYWIIYILLIALGTCGDAVILIIAVLPVTLYELIRIASVKKEILYSPYKLIGATVGGAFLGSRAEKLFFLLGGANKNSFLEKKSFISIDQLWTKIQIFFDALFRMFDAYFWEGNIYTGKLPCHIINSLIIVSGFAISVAALLNVVRGIEQDYITEVLAVSVFFMTAIFVLTDLSVDINSARYLAYFTVAFVILIVRNIGALTNSIFLKKAVIINGILVLSIVSSLFRIHYWSNAQNLIYPQKKLSDFLTDQGLKKGLAGFWDASITTVLSEENVSVRAVYYNDQQKKFDMYNWFCKDDWYSENAVFLVTTDGNMFGVTEQNAIDALGVPAETLQFEKWNVLVYNKDLSKELIRNQKQ